MTNKFNYKKLSLLILLSISANLPQHSLAATLNIKVGQHKIDDNDFTKVAISGTNTSVEFSSQDVSISALNSGLWIEQGASVIFDNNLNVIGAPNQTTSNNVAVIDNGSLLVKGNLDITGEGTYAPHVNVASGGTANILGDLNIHHTGRHASHDATLIDIGQNGTFHVLGNTKLVNDGTGAGIRVQWGGQGIFDGNLSLSQHATGLTVSENSSLIIKGDTNIAVSDDIQPNHPPTAINSYATSLTSLGYINQETQAELDVNRLTHAQVYIGQNANVSVDATNHPIDSTALNLRATNASLVIIDGLLSATSTGSSKAWSILSSGKAADTVKLRNGGNLIGMVSLGDGDDALFIDTGPNGGVVGNIYMGRGNDKIVTTSGHIKGDIYLDDGDDLFDFTGGKITGKAMMGSGQDQAFIRNGADISELYNIDGGASIDNSSTGEITFEGQKVRAYSGYRENRENGLLLSSWSTVSLKENSELTLTGNGLFDITKGTLNIDNSSALKLEGINASKIVAGHVNNQGTIDFANKNAGETLTVTGNYTGNDGLIIFDVQLGDDNSLTDKLIVGGDTSGNTLVKVNNIGGLGALTDKGIELISVSGVSDGSFKQDGRIVAGAYDYFLNRGNSVKGSDKKNWYLTSELPTTLPPKPQEPEPPCDCITPQPPKPQVPAPLVRPEAGSYIANMATANSLFVMRLHDRLGETQYTDILTGEKKVTSLWLRQIGGHNRARDSSGQLKTQSNRYVVQMGGDIADWSSDGLDRWHLGLMAGYGNSHSNTDSTFTGYTSRGTVSGYSVGIYGTWYANKDIDKNGTYIDTWAQYGWFNNTVKGQGLNGEKYDSRGITASIEAGHTYNVGQYDERTRYFIQPKAQVIWMGIGADDHREQNGTSVKSSGKNNIQTRLGLRTYLSGHSSIDDGKDRTFEPFIEANWIHNTKNMGAKMNGVTHQQVGDDDLVELKTGVEAQLNKKFTGWINVAEHIGDKGYSDTSVILGMKYSF